MKFHFTDTTTMRYGGSMAEKSQETIRVLLLLTTLLLSLIALLLWKQVGNPVLTTLFGAGACTSATALLIQDQGITTKVTLRHLFGTFAAAAVVIFLILTATSTPATTTPNLSAESHDTQY